LTVISGEPCGSPGDTRVIGYCAVFKVREEAHSRRRSPGPRPAGAGGELVSQNSTACGPPRDGAPAWRAGTACDLPDSVDMSSGRLRSAGASLGLDELERRSAGSRCPKRAP